MVNGSTRSVAAEGGGTQAIERALLVLRVLASNGRRGMRVADIAAASALPQSTVSRMLGTLVREGVVERDARLRRYFVGHVVHELALVARLSYELPQACQPAMRDLAQLSEDTVYLSERSGTDAVCTAREEGHYPIKALPLHVGIRRPLGVGAGGLAILAAMEDAQAREVMQACAARYPAYGGVDLGFLESAIARARQDGWATIADKATAGMSAIAVAVRGRSGEPVGAISIAAISSRMTAQRCAQLGRALAGHCARVSAALQAGRNEA